jgi:hypothetical protein
VASQGVREFESRTLRRSGLVQRFSVGEALISRSDVM